MKKQFSILLTILLLMVTANISAQKSTVKSKSTKGLTAQKMKSKASSKGKTYKLTSKPKAAAAPYVGDKITCPKDCDECMSGVVFHSDEARQEAYDNSGEDIGSAGDCLRCKGTGICQRCDGKGYYLLKTR